MRPEGWGSPGGRAVAKVLAPIADRGPTTSPTKFVSNQDMICPKPARRCSGACTVRDGGAGVPAGMRREGMGDSSFLAALFLPAA